MFRVHDSHYSFFISLFYAVIISINTSFFCFDFLVRTLITKIKHFFSIYLVGLVYICLPLFKISLAQILTWRDFFFFLILLYSRQENKQVISLDKLNTSEF